MKKFTFILSLVVLIGLNSNLFAQWETNGSDIFYNNGNIGLGTNNPGFIDYSHPTQVITLKNDCSSIEFLGNRSSDGESIGWLEFMNNENRVLDFVVWRENSGKSGKLSIRTNNGNGGISSGNMIERFSLLNNGNIGIGVSAPNEKLEVNGNILIKDNNALILTSPNGTEFKITVDDSGNLTTSAVSTKIAEIENETEINIYPNPTENSIKIDLQTNEMQDISVELYDITGKIVYLKSYKTNLINMDISDFETGTYILKVKNNNGEIIKTEKIIRK